MDRFHALFDYRWTRQPEGGSARFAFRYNQTLPLFELQGPGIVPDMQYNVVGPEQVYVIHDTIAAGLQGIVAGQIALQRLIDTRYVNGIPTGPL